MCILNIWKTFINISSIRSTMHEHILVDNTQRLVKVHLFAFDCVFYSREQCFEH